MADDQEKVVAPKPAAAAKCIPRDKTLTSEERRIQDALEDDEVRESLKELHAHKARSG